MKITLKQCSTIMAAVVPFVLVVGAAADEMGQKNPGPNASESVQPLGNDGNIISSVGKNVINLETVGQLFSKLHMIDLMEIRAGNLALEKSQNSQVKRYGDRLVKDHQNADGKILALAHDKGIVISDPFKPANAQERRDVTIQNEKMTELQKLSGPDFDLAFLKFMEDGHRQTIAMLKMVRPQLGSSQQGRLIGKLIPILEQHEVMADHIDQKVSSNKNYFHK